MFKVIQRNLQNFTKKNKLHNTLQTQDFTNLYQNYTTFFTTSHFLQNRTNPYQSLQHHTNIYKTVQNFTELYKTLYNYTKPHKTKVYNFYNTLQHYTQILQNFTKLYKDIYTSNFATLDKTLNNFYATLHNSTKLYKLNQ